MKIIHRIYKENSVSFNIIILTLILMGNLYTQSLNKKDNSYLDHLGIGHWTSEKKENQLLIHFKSRDRSRYGFSRYIDLNDLKQGKDSENVTYTLESEAGKIIFYSDGNYEFSDNAKMDDFLKSKGVKKRPIGMLLMMTLGDFGKECINILEDENYKISVDNIVATSLLNQVVLREKVAFMKKHFPSNKDARSLRRLCIYDIDESTFLSVKKYVNVTSVDQVIRWKSKNIDNEYVEMLKNNGFSEPSFEDIIRARNRGISQDYIVTLQEQNFNDLNLRKIITAKSRGISEEYIKSIKVIGYQDISLGNIISFRSKGITPIWINKINKSSKEIKTANELIKLKRSSKN